MSRSKDADDWAAILSMGPLSSEHEAELALWLDSRHRRAALTHARVRFAFLERAQSVLPPEAMAQGRSRRQILGWGTAALAAGATGLWLMPDGGQLSTSVGEIRRSRLADTSIVTLNTQSRVTVDLAPEERRIKLDQGEAWFKVAHDRKRPFIVSAAGVQVRAIGTAFSVRRVASGVDVLVTEGTVEVWRDDAPGERTRLSADHRLFAADSGAALVPVSGKTSIERALAWRTGRLAFAGEALDYAVAELNRYNAVQLQVDDPALGRLPVYGYFRTDDPRGFAQMISTSEDARIEANGSVIKLIPQRL